MDSISLYAFGSWCSKNLARKGREGKGREGKGRGTSNIRVNHVAPLHSRVISSGRSSTATVPPHAKYNDDDADDDEQRPAYETRNLDAMDNTVAKHDAVLELLR